MKRTRTGKRIATTVGELLSAVWEAAPGLGLARAERAAVLIAVSPLTRRASRTIQFVR
ncbi:MAG: hypothetical protein HZB56_07000 [Deltaproteobacteria bacterium]|nr:hypothetical protein [Deltaproteobacteria bacterium]